MSFSLEVKDELAHGSGDRECCQRALLAAMLLGHARMEHGEDGGYGILETTSAPSVRLFLRCSRNATGTGRLGRDGPHLGVTWEARRGSGMMYRIRVGPLFPNQPFLDRLGLEAVDGDLRLRAGDAAWKRRKCCRRAFLRGAFLAGGSVTHPTRSYHLEWITRGEAYQDALCGLLGEMELPARTLHRRGHVALYLKGAADIARALTLMGATRSLLYLEEVRAVKETKNLVHRRVNCETANLDRTTRAAVRQVSDIKYLLECLGLQGLPAELRSVARARLRYPEASYAELGERLSPRLTKLTVARSLQRLEKLAHRLRARTVGDAGAPQKQDMGCARQS